MYQCDFCLKQADFKIETNIKPITSVLCCDNCVVKQRYMNNHGSLLTDNLYYFYSNNIDDWVKLPLGENENE